MELFHLHAWVEHGRHFNPPLLDVSVGSCSSRDAHQMAWGYTVILMKCEKCGDQKAVDVVGDATLKP